MPAPVKWTATLLGIAHDQTLTSRQAAEKIQRVTGRKMTAESVRQVRSRKHIKCPHKGGRPAKSIYKLGE